MDLDNLSTKQKSYFYCCICVSVFALVFLIMSWDTVEPTEYGLICSKLTKTCDKDYIYESGRHWTSPFNYFIKFPRSLKTIEFSGDA